MFTRLIGIVRLQVASFCVLERRKGRVKEVKKRRIEGKEPLVGLNGGELGADRKVIENGERLGVERTCVKVTVKTVFKQSFPAFKADLLKGGKDAVSLCLKGTPHNQLLSLQ